MKNKILKALGIFTASAIAGSILVTSISSCIKTEPNSNRENSINFDGQNFKSEKELVQWAQENLKKTSLDSKTQYVIFDGIKNIYFDNPYSVYLYLNENNMIQEKKSFLPSNIGQLYEDNKTYNLDPTTNRIFGIPITNLEEAIGEIYQGKNDIFYENEEEALKSLYFVSEVYEFNNKFFVNRGALVKYIKDLNDKTKEILSPGDSSSILSLAANNGTSIQIPDIKDISNLTDSSKNSIASFVNQNTKKVLCLREIIVGESEKKCYDPNNDQHLEKIKTILKDETNSIDNKEYLDLSAVNTGVYLIDLDNDSAGDLSSPYLIESSSSILQEMANSDWVKQESFSVSSKSTLMYESLIDLTTNLILSSILDTVKDEESDSKITNPVTELLFNADLDKLLETMLDFEYDFSSYSSKTEIDENEIENEINQKITINETKQEDIFIDDISDGKEIDDEEVINLLEKEDEDTKKKIEKIYGNDGIITRIRRFRDSGLAGALIGREYNPQTGMQNNQFKSLSNSLITFENQIANGKRYSPFKSIPLLRTIALNSIVYSPVQIKGGVSIVDEAFMGLLDLIDIFAKNQYKNSLATEALVNFKLSKIFSFGKENKSIYTPVSAYIQRAIEEKDFTNIEKTNIGSLQFFNGIIHMFSIMSLNSQISDSIQFLYKLTEDRDFYNLFDSATQQALRNLISSKVEKIKIFDEQNYDYESTVNTYTNIVSDFNKIKEIVNNAKKTSIATYSVTAALSGPLAVVAAADAALKIKKLLKEVDSYIAKFDLSTSFELLKISSKDLNGQKINIDTYSINQILLERQENFNTLSQDISKRVKLLKDDSFSLDEYLSQDTAFNKDFMETYTKDEINAQLYNDELFAVSSYMNLIDEDALVNRLMSENIRERIQKNIEYAKEPTYLERIRNTYNEINYWQTKAKSVYSELKNRYNKLTKELTKDIGTIKKYSDEFIKSFKETVVKDFNKIKDSLSKKGTQMIQSLKNFYNKNFNVTWKGIKSFLSDTSDKIKIAINKIKVYITKIYNNIKTKAMTVLKRFYNANSSRLQKIGLTIKQWIASAKAKIQLFKNKVKLFIKKINDSEIMKKIKSIAKTISKFVMKYAKKAKDATMKLVKKVSEYATMILKGAKALLKTIGTVAKVAYVAIELLTFILGDETKESYEMIIGEENKKIIWNGGSRKEHSLFGIKLFDSAVVDTSAIKFAAKFKIKDSMGQKYFYNGKTYNEYYDVLNNYIKDVVYEAKNGTTLSSNKFEVKYFLDKKTKNKHEFISMSDENIVRDSEKEILDEVENRMKDFISIDEGKKTDEKYSFISKKEKNSYGLFNEEEAINFSNDLLLKKIDDGDYKPWLYIQLPQYYPELKRYVALDSALVPNHPSADLSNIKEGTIVLDDGTHISNPDTETKYVFLKPYYNHNVNQRKDLDKSTPLLSQDDLELLDFNKQNEKLINNGFYHPYTESNRENLDFLLNKINDIVKSKLTNGVNKKKVLKYSYQYNESYKKKKFSDIPELLIREPKEHEIIKTKTDLYIHSVYKGFSFDGEIEYFIDKAAALRWLLAKSSYRIIDSSTSDYMYEYEYKSDESKEEKLKFLTIDEFVEYVMRKNEVGLWN